MIATANENNVLPSERDIPRKNSVAVKNSITV